MLSFVFVKSHKIKNERLSMRVSGFTLPIDSHTGELGNEFVDLEVTNLGNFVRKVGKSSPVFIVSNIVIVKY